MPRREGWYARLDPIRKRAHLDKLRLWRIGRRPAIPPRKKSGILRRAKLDWVATQKTQCSRCPESNSVCLDFHHRDPKTKDYNIGTMLSSGKSWSLARLQEEVAKCDVLCSNCHRKLHFKPYTPERKG